MKNNIDDYDDITVRMMIQYRWWWWWFSTELMYLCCHLLWTSDQSCRCLSKSVDGVWRKHKRIVESDSKKTKFVVLQPKWMNETEEITRYRKLEINQSQHRELFSQNHRFCWSLVSWEIHGKIFYFSTELSSWFCVVRSEANTPCVRGRRERRSYWIA